MATAREETTRLAEMLCREHHALAEFLVALAAFDRERRWVELGHRSLFYFLVRELGLPKGPAYYRMTAAGLVQKYPELVEPLRDGRLHLTSLVEVSKVITPENRAEVLPRFFRASKQEAKAIAAAILPAEAPPVRTLVAAIRAPTVGPPSHLPAAALPGHLPALLAPRASIAAAHAPASGTVSAPAPGSAVLPEEPTPCQLAVPGVVPPLAARRAERAEVEPLTADLRRMHVTVSRRLLEKLAAARDALSHSHPGASDDEILEVGLDLIVERHRKRRGIGAKPQAPSQAPKAPEKTSSVSSAATSLETTPLPPPSEAPPSPARSRHVPAAVWRAVWVRDGARCAWSLENGGVCGSTRQLELDHVRGWALGADTAIDECRLLCRFHQDLSARQLYGNDLMDTYTRPKSGRCSEPVAVYSRTESASPCASAGSRPRHPRRGAPALPATSPATPQFPRARTTPVRAVSSAVRARSACASS